MEIIRPALYVVGTPIGNLSDFSPRGREVLEAVDFICAEDTRVTSKLLFRFEIHKELLSYHSHNRTSRGAEVLSRLREGQVAAIVTDAGMPAVSDPGQELVALAAGADIPVFSVPGPCAAVTAAALSGLDCSRFTFEGFLSTNKGSRRERLSELKNERRAMIFYEAPHKLRSTLSDLLEVLGDRPVALCREMTKLHEETLRCTLSEAVALYGERTPKGEYVLVLEGCQGEAAPPPAVTDEGGEPASRGEAVRRAATLLGMSKNELYRLLSSKGEEK